MTGTVDCVVGLQWGSEGKGRFAALMAERTAYRAAVRVGGPNAGHVVELPDGQRVTFRSIPSAAATAVPALIIGRGAVINPEILEAEILAAEAAGLKIRNRLLIDRRAVIIDREARLHETDLVPLIGSTAEGVGYALRQKIARDGKIVFTKDLPYFGKLGVLTDTVQVLHELVEQREWIQVEGTQGTLLSIDFGDYPFVTSQNQTAAALFAACGVPFTACRDIIGVARTYPIRVGGNSGPMSHEVDWDYVTRESGSAVAIQETTTVTKRVRRVAKFDMESLKYAVRLNGCTGLAVSFLDYLVPQSEFGDVEGPHHDMHTMSGSIFEFLPSPAHSFLATLAAQTKVPIAYCSWGSGYKQAAVL